MNFRVFIDNFMNFRVYFRVFIILVKTVKSLLFGPQLLSVLAKPGQCLLPETVVISRKTVFKSRSIAAFSLKSVFYY